MVFGSPNIRADFVDMIRKTLARYGSSISYTPSRFIGLDDSKPPTQPRKAALPYGNRKRPAWLRKHRRMLRNGWHVHYVNEAGGIAYIRQYGAELCMRAPLDLSNLVVSGRIEA